MGLKRRKLLRRIGGIRGRRGKEDIWVQRADMAFGNECIDQYSYPRYLRPNDPHHRLPLRKLP